MRLATLGVVSSDVVTIDTNPPAYNSALNTTVPGAGINPALSSPAAPALTGPCPVGYSLDSSGAVCLPNGTTENVGSTVAPAATSASTLISGVPDWLTYAGGGLVLLGLLMGGRR